MMDTYSLLREFADSWFLIAMVAYWGVRWVVGGATFVDMLAH